MDDCRTRTDGRPRAYSTTGNSSGADAKECSLPHCDVPCEIAAGTDVNEILDNAVVIDRRRRVEDHVLADRRARLHHRFREGDAPIPK